MALKWLEEKEPTRKRSDKHEKKLVKKFKGKLFSNSGARFGENDLKTEFFEIEAKTTSQKGYRVTLKELTSIKNKCRGDKIPLQIIQFEETNENFVVLNLEDFYEIVNRQTATE